MVFDVCPNVNLKEWKLMVTHLGSEREAYRAYIAHNHTIPFVLSLSDFKRVIGLTSGRYSVEQQKRINMRLRYFNQKYGTSHFIKYTPYGTGELSTAEVRFNYLPVNKKAQEDRDRRKRMQGYIDLVDAESVESVSRPKTERDLYMLDRESDLGQFTDEGDFIAPSYFGDSEVRYGPKFQELILSKKQDIKILYQNLERQKEKRKDINDPVKRLNILKTINKIENKIEDVKKQIVKLENLNRLDQIEEYALEDMDTLSRIFGKDKPTSEDLQVAERLIKIWQRAGDFSGNNPHIFYSEAEINAKDDSGLREITQKFEGWRKKADDYHRLLVKRQEKIMDENLIETFGNNIEIDYRKPWKDVNGLLENVLDISEVDNAVLQAIHQWVSAANIAANDELEEIYKKIDELIKKADLKDFEIFAQTFSNTDKRKTGDLVFRFSQTYFDWERKINADRDNKLEKAEGLGKKAVAIIIRANREYIRELRENTVVFDPRILFYNKELYDSPEPTQKQKDDHIKMLKSHLGEKGFNEYYKYHERKIEEFKNDREAFISNLKDRHGENLAIIENELASYEMRNSPYYFAEVMEKGYDAVTYKGQHAYPSNRYLRVIPKRINNNKDTGFYDAKFDQIEANENLLELYNYMFDLLKTLKSYLPTEKINFMHINSLPFLKKKMYETIQNGGVKAGFSLMKDDLKESVRTDDLATVTDDPNKKEIQIHHVQNIQPRIDAEIQIRTVEYMTTHNNKPKEDIIAEWRKEITDRIVSEEKSFELDRILKAFASTAVTYKHRSLIEDNIRIARNIIQRAAKAKTNAANDPQIDRFGKPHTDEEGLKKMQSMLENFLDVAYWGYPSNKPEGQSKNGKILTESEKRMKKMLEEGKANAKKLLDQKVITEVEYAGQIEVFDDQLNSLGGIRTASKYGDMLLKYIQMKGMGWNIVAGFSNLGFGFISNLIEASDGRNFSQKSFFRALGLTLNSVGRNFTFNSWDGLDHNGKKIRVLMDKFDTLKESKNEVYKPSKSSLFRKIGDKLEWANPYSIQSRTEYFNQAPILIAMLMDTKVKMKTADGEKTISMWDAYNVDGSLKEGVILSDEDRIKTKIRIDKVIKFTHGNYDPNSPIKIKRIFIGRALSQFRTWAYEGFSERFRGDIRDYQLMNLKTGENFIDRRGRYRSLLRYMKKNDKMMYLEGIFGLTYQMLRKLTGFKTQFDESVDEKFDTTDAANMRKNMTEIVFYSMITVLALLLKGAYDDEDDKEKKAVITFLINQLLRLNTDIMFYTNPMEFEKLTRNAIPAFAVVVDASKVLQDAWTLITGGEDILQSGPNKGESRFLRDLSKIIPGPAQGQKIKSITGTLYNKNFIPK